MVREKRMCDDGCAFPVYKIEDLHEGFSILALYLKINRDD